MKAPVAKGYAPSSVPGKVITQSTIVPSASVPPDLVDAFTRVHAVLDRGSPLLEQAVVAAFIADGHMARHVRRMRTVYAERQAALVEAARSELAGFLELVPAEAGVHLLGWLPTGVNDRQVADQATRHGVETRPLSDFRVADSARGGLLLGYAAYPPEAIRTGVRTLADAAGAATRAATQAASRRRALRACGGAGRPSR